jgi:PAS domain S-box-containing protein
MSVNIDSFTQQVQLIQGRLNLLYQGANSSVPLQSDLLPLAFRELGIVSEELQVAIEELQEQNTALAEARNTVEIERQRYQELFDFAPDAYLVTDAAGTIQEANSAAAKLLNVTPHLLVGKPLLVFVAEEERQTFYLQLLQLQTLEQMKEWVLHLCPRHSQPFKASITVATVRDHQDKVVGLRLCIRNTGNGWTITELESNDFDLNQNGLKHVYLKGEIIPLKPQTIWLVCRGIVKLITISETGEEVLLGLVGPSMPFGSDLTSLETYQATALCEVELACFSSKDLTASPNLARKILPKINQRLQQTEALLAIFGKRRAKDRLHYLLGLLKQEFGQSVAQGTRLAVRLTHQELAAACSTTRVTITRMLGKLQEEGKIIIDSKNHIILQEREF